MVKLEQGEKELAKDAVTYLSPSAGPVSGTLTVTNLRVVFEPDQGQEGDAPAARTATEVLLGDVARVVKFGGMTTRTENGYGYTIHCKSIRQLSFAVLRVEHRRRKTYNPLVHAAFRGPELFKENLEDLAAASNASGPNGWEVFKTDVEFARQGVPNDAWRLTSVNADYKVSPTYPALIGVPATITDEQLRSVARYRTKGRFPALSWYHPTNGSVICRSSQPKPGLLRRSNKDDEALIEAIIKTNPNNAELLILDARPLLNAIANQAKGAGAENVSRYAGAEIVFQGIGNIHTMRQSYERLRELCLSMDSNTAQRNWYRAVEDTRWLRHGSIILHGAAQMVDLLEKQGKSVIVHCSDGWDRTAQLSGLAMLCLDPYYRTITGFEVLIEKEWLSFGHKFAQRIGHGNGKANDSQRSPVFLQFIDCVWQITQQFPSAFQFNEAMLIDVLDHLFSLRYGTFMCNNERERKENKLKETTPSLWDAVNSNRAAFTNPNYLEVDGAIVPSYRLNELRVWTSYFLRHVEQHDTSGKRVALRGAAVGDVAAASDVATPTSIHQHQVQTHGDVPKLKAQVAKLSAQLEAANKEIAELKAAMNGSTGSRRGSRGSFRRRRSKRAPSEDGALELV